MYLSTLGLAVAILACRDMLSPFEQLRAPSANRYLNGAGQIVVYPDSMHGWSFYNDQQSVACTDATVCRFVSGPASVPLGSGSAELAVASTSEGKALILVDYKGVRLDQLTTLSYSTYRQTTNSGNNLAISLQLNADFDLSDNATGYQGRLVYEPYLTASGQVVDNVWQNWDAKAGKWWGTKTTVSKGGVTLSNPCVQSSPCTWSQLVAAFPNAGIHTTYGAVVLKAGSGWTNFRGNLDKLAIGISGSTTTFNFEAAAPVAFVPIAAPDSVPDAVWDSLKAPGNVIANGPGMVGALIRDALLVVFKPGASQAERQAAIEIVNGRVIGGTRIGGRERFYVVRIPYVLAPGDSVSGPLLRAVNALRNQAAVDAATVIPLSPMKASYRTPKDGAGFNSWPLSRDSLGGNNWGQVAVNAPFAWGCATGLQTGVAPPIIAVVDYGFHDIDDLRSNLGAIREFADPSDTNNHGNAVASLIGAVGNNQMGITGMMWNATLNLIDLKRANHSPDAILWTEKVSRAVASGARVINISWGIDPNLTFPTGHPATPDDRMKVEAYRIIYAQAIEGSRDSVTNKLNTLFVVGSGNNEGDAYEEGWPGFVDDPRYKDNVIAVAHTSKVGGSGQALATSANSGHLIEIAAPGDGIMSLGPQGLPVTVYGSSFATPLVSGAAGLLFAFDPALTPADVKKLLVDGAKLGKREVSDIRQPAVPIPVLDAYSSLRLAGQRSTAPLCGNRVYANAAGDVSAERGPSSQPEKLFTSVDAPYADLLNSLHGGRRIQIGDYLEYKWSPLTRTWSESTFDGNYHDDAGGAFLSWYDGSDHDATMYHVTNGSAVSGFRAQFATLPEQEPMGVTSAVLAPVRNVIGNLACSYGAKDSLVTYADCPLNAATLIGSSENPHQVSALAPQGNFVLIGINYRMQSQSYGPVYGSSGNLVPTTANMRDTSVSFELWSVDTASLRDLSRLPQKVKVSWASPFNEYSRDGLEIAWLAIDETGTEVVMELRKRVSDYTAGVFTCTNRTIEYRALAGHAPMPNRITEEGSLIHSTQLPDLTRKCPSAFGPATFSPYRGTLLAKRSRASAPRPK